MLIAVFTAFFINAISINANMNSERISLDSTSVAWADSTLKTMSVDEKIGQLFMMSVFPDANKGNMGKEYEEAKKYHVGGVCFFAGDAATQIKITNEFNNEAKIPLLIGIDGEWGPAMRVTDALPFPYAMNVGAVSDSNLVYEMGQQIGKQCHRLGVHINFAPVHDLNSNPLNPVINYRSYGSGTENVSEKVRNYINGMQSEGVLAVAKHFPGHGDTKTDSHHALPVIKKSREDFEQNEFVPFRSSINDGLQAIMIGHLDVPSLDTVDMPASLSPEIIQNIVKGEMGFNGLIVSDALNMYAVAKGYENHYLKAFEAGNDILLFPADLGEGVRQLKVGLENGDITVDQLDERCRRVLAYKKALGVPDFKPLSDQDVVKDLNSVPAKVLNRRLLEQSITLVKNDEEAIPIKHLGKKKIAVLAISNKGNAFNEESQLYTQVDLIDAKSVKVEDTDSLIATLKDYDEVIVGLHGQQKKWAHNYGVSKQSIKLLSGLAEKKKVHVVLMANPYAFCSLPEETFNNLSSLIFTYGNEEEIQRLAADAIFGGLGCKGVFPLKVNDFLCEGMCCVTKKCRLGYSPVPEEVGLSSDTLAHIDDIVDEMISEKMAPGCQILVAKDGKVIYNKSFGYYTYDKRKKVDNDDLYDVASVTKIAATTPLVMQYVDEGRLIMNTGIETYLSELKDNAKGQLTLQQMMLHQAGLKNYIGFDFYLLDEDKMTEKLFHKGKTSTYSIRLTPTIYMTRNYVMKEGYISTKSNERFSVKVADGIYTFSAYRDTMYQLIDDSELSSNKDYCYSDLGFYYAMRVVERISNKQLDSLAEERLYAPLGMNHTCYCPLNRFTKENVVPTVDEGFFRKQWLQGYVHDQGAALMGGVAGHAGIFSNANDLAKLLQTYLDAGFYGGESYFKPETLHYFTQHTENGFRRGIGFDKPEPESNRPQPTCESAPLQCFGHTGFTGTGVWADPENDLIYIILTNRVCPHPYNNKFVNADIRPRIQQVIYDALISVTDPTK